METGILEALQYVTGGFSLAAFVGALILFAYRSRLQAKVDLIQSLPEADKAASLSALGDSFQVPTEGLNNVQKLRVIEQQVAIRARRDIIIAVVLVIFALLGTFVVAWVLPHQSLPEALSRSIYDTDMDRADEKTRTNDPTATLTVTATLCYGEDETKCGFAHTDFIGCGADVTNWFEIWKTRVGCVQKVSNSQFGNRGGGHCGYAEYRASCLVIGM